VFYQELLTDDITEFQNVSAKLFEYHGLEPIARRNVHTALITGLKSNTKYLTKVYYDNQFWTNAIYKTLPSEKDNVPIRMINAGDSGNTAAALNLSKIVSTLKPDIFFMGGDIAYDDNMPACAYTWDYFLNMYEKICS
jgi:phosphodiesterase/alkaline phosphatase D-like protein